MNGSAVGRRKGLKGVAVGRRRVVWWAQPLDERKASKKKGEVTKRRLVHIFQVKTSAAESGCGGTSGGSEDDGNLPADILCVLRARQSNSVPVFLAARSSFCFRLDHLVAFIFPLKFLPIVYSFLSQL